MAADLAALGEQMVRLARAGAPAAEEAAGALVSPEECFGWLVAAAELVVADASAETRTMLRGLRRRRAPRRVDAAAATTLTFLPYVGDGQPTYYEHYLPRASDRDFDAYVARVGAKTAPFAFGFQVPNLQVADWDAYARLLQVVSPLLRMLGPRPARFTCFFGTHPDTPFGAHVDAHHLHAFQYVVRGRKRLHAWDSSALVRRFGEAALVDFYRTAPVARRTLPSTAPITAGPGGLLYWPGGHTHRLASDGPSIGLSIVVEAEPVRLWDLAASHVRPLVDPPRPAARSLRPNAGTPRRPVPGLARAGVTRRLARLARQIGRRSTATAVLHELVLDRSGRAVAAPPARMRGRRVAVTDVLESRLTPPFRIMHATDGGRVVIAVHGHGSEWTDAGSARDVVALLAFLNRVRRVRVCDVVARCVRPGRFARADVLALLRFCTSAGAFAVARDARPDRSTARCDRAAVALTAAIAPERARMAARDRRRLDELLAGLHAPSPRGERLPPARRLARRLVRHVGRDPRRHALALHVLGRGAHRLAPGPDAAGAGRGDATDAGYVDATGAGRGDATGAARADAWTALLLAAAALSPSGARRLGRLPFVDERLLAALCQEVGRRLAGGRPPRVRMALSPGPVLSRFAADPRLRRVAERALGCTLAPAGLAVYLHEPPRSVLGPHLDASRYEVIVHLVLTHAVPRGRSRGSALVVHRPSGVPARISLAPGEAVALGGRGSVHGWQPLAARERRTMIAIGFRRRDLRAERAPQ